jgi:phenylacetate-CoA ligase
MLLSSSGTSGAPRVFRHSHTDRELWVWATARAIHAMGGMDVGARGRFIVRYSPAVLLCTPSYALHLARVLQNNNIDPRSTAIEKILVGGEPAISIPATRNRIQDLWDARLVEFYGCTEVSPHVG